MKVFGKSVAEQDPPPCEKYNCRLYGRCGSERLACEAFGWYVVTGESVDPRTRWQKKKGRSARKSNIYPVLSPSRDTYKKIYKEANFSEVEQEIV